MLRSTRPLLKPAYRTVLAGEALAIRCATPTAARWRPLPSVKSAILASPRIWSTQFSSTSAPRQSKIDREHEKELAQQKLESNPDAVTTESSVRHIIESSPASTEKAKQDDHDMATDLKQDIKHVVHTFELKDVPREPYMLGFAGTLPYLATSLTTVFLSWNLNTAWPTSSHFLNSIMLSHETAQQWLQQLEPIQVGIGAVIISSLGAIHWGIEWAEKSAPDKARSEFRYLLGIAASAVAWPTVFMPVQWALTTQFFAFTVIYFADARATVRGWVPAWYGTYRIVLTFIVCASIFISLVARTKIGSTKAELTTSDLETRMERHTVGEEPYDEKWEKLELEEKARIRKEKKEEEKRKKDEEAKKKQEERIKEKNGGRSKDNRKQGSKDDEKSSDSDDDEKADKKDGDEQDDKDEGKDKKSESDKDGGDDKKSEGEKDGGDDKKSGGEKDGGNDKKSGDDKEKK